MPWARRISRPIPRSSSRSESFEINDYSLGMDSFVSNDKFPLKNGQTNKWRLAQDARIPALGEYETRKGFDFYSDAAGEAQDQSITSTTGADDQPFSGTSRLAQVFTAGQTGHCSKVEINIRKTSDAIGVVIVELWSDSSGEPGERLARSSVDPASITGTYQYLTARFANAPELTSSEDYWIVVYVQEVSDGAYEWSSTTSTNTALSSSSSGSAWESANFALNFKQHYCTTGAPKGLHRAVKSDGTAITLIAHGTSLYSVDDVTGDLTEIKSGLSASATHYRFTTVNDTVYYVNGFNGLRKWDFSTESQVNATNYTNICLHKGLLFLLRKDDPQRWDFSNFGDYETFTSTDFITVPAPKTGDPCTAAMSLNGYLVLSTLHNKYILSGDDNATFQLDEAPDQKGTYTQETMTADKNFIYYLSDDGVYRSNGSEAQLLSENVYEDIRSLNNKDDAIIAVNKGRLYLWYRSAGSSYNDSCWVWNLNYSGDSDTVESHDTDAFVSRAVVSPADDNGLLVASSRIGQVYWQERDSNDYTNLGGDINFELRTHYMHFGSPAVLKEIRFWKPRFAAQTGNYVMSVQYAVDLRDSATSLAFPDVQGLGYIWGDAGTVWGSFWWGTDAEKQADLYVPGEYRRIQLRYKHYATRQPQKFLGHSLVVQTRRLK